MARRKTRRVRAVVDQELMKYARIAGPDLPLQVQPSHEWLEAPSEMRYPTGVRQWRMTERANERTFIPVNRAVRPVVPVVVTLDEPYDFSPEYVSWQRIGGGVRLLRRRHVGDEHTRRRRDYKDRSRRSMSRVSALTGRIWNDPRVVNTFLRTYGNPVLAADSVAVARALIGRFE